MLDENHPSVTEHRLVDRSTRPTWDVATDEQILEEIKTVAASGYHYCAFPKKIWDLLVERELDGKVREILGVKCLTL